MVLNVRLSTEEERVVRGLRRAKVNVSDLVRRALREAGKTATKKSPAPSVAVKELIAAYPGPAVRKGQPALDDRHAVKAFITRKLTRK